MTCDTILSPRVSVAWGALALCTLLSSCSLLDRRPLPYASTYVLDLDAEAALPVDPSTKPRHVLLVEVPRAIPGYNSTHMVYVRKPMLQEAYANSAWADTPAHMLAPMLRTRLAQSGAFRAVLLTPSAAKADLRLDSTVLRLQQDFTQAPSVVRFGMQLTLMNNVTREVLAVHTLEVSEIAVSDDAVGGARAANAAVKRGLQQVAAFLQTAIATLPKD